MAALPLAGIPRMLGAQSAVRRLTDRLAVVDGGGANVLAYSGTDGLVLVDSGAPQSGESVMAALNGLGGSAKVQTLFNTHYHPEQTGNNELFAAGGAKIIAHDRTRQWMSSGYWIPSEERYEKARSQAARPAQTFQTTGSLRAGDERIDYGHLLLAHTAGDIYVYFRNANVLAVGDAASPLRDPALDYFTGAWIGARVDAMDLVRRVLEEGWHATDSYGRRTAEAKHTVSSFVLSLFTTPINDGYSGRTGGPTHVQKISTKIVDEFVSKDLTAEMVKVRAALKEQVDGIIAGKFVEALRSAVGLSR